MKVRNRELLMLAQTFDSHQIGGWYASEKYDGQRAVWLPWTRGTMVTDIHFANRARDSRNHMATGLWSRYGKVIHAPEWFCNHFPTDRILDGELYMGRGSHQELRTIVSTLIPSGGWDRVKFKLLDMPSRNAFETPGMVNNPNYSYRFPDFPPRYDSIQYQFGIQYELMQQYCAKLSDSPIELATQIRIPFNRTESLEFVDSELTRITQLGGEGLILRAPGSVWEPYRSHSVLKVKKLLDSEAIIVGFVTGRGKLRGLFGAMIVDWEGKRFELSGFTDSERVLSGESAIFANMHEGVQIPIEFRGEIAQHFQIGDTVTFLYRELTDSGTPKEARYWRTRNE